MEDDVSFLDIRIPFNKHNVRSVKDYPQLLKTLIFTLILVPVMGISIPKLHKKFWNWITK